MQNEDNARDRTSLTPDEDLSVEGTHIADEEQGVAAHTTPLPTATNPDETEPQRAESTVAHASKFIKHKTSQLLEVVTSVSSTKLGARQVSPKLSALVNSYASSQIAEEIRQDIAASTVQTATGSDERVSQELPDVSENLSLRGHRRASWGTQFRILSGRAFKNLYRDPALLTAHYVSSIVIARKSDF